MTLKPVYACIVYNSICPKGYRQLVICLSDAEFYVPFILFIVWVFGTFCRTSIFFGWHFFIPSIWYQFVMRALKTILNPDTKCMSSLYFLKWQNSRMRSAQENNIGHQPVLSTSSNVEWNGGICFCHNSNIHVMTSPALSIPKMFINLLLFFVISLIQSLCLFFPVFASARNKIYYHSLFEIENIFVRAELKFELLSSHRILSLKAKIHFRESEYWNFVDAHQMPLHFYPSMIDYCKIFIPILGNPLTMMMMSSLKVFFCFHSLHSLTKKPQTNWNDV